MSAASKNRYSRTPSRFSQISNNFGSDISTSPIKYQNRDFMNQPTENDTLSIQRSQTPSYYSIKKRSRNYTHKYDIDFTNSISFARKNAEINKFKRSISHLKNKFVTDFEAFHSDLVNKHRQVRNFIYQSLSSKPNPNHMHIVYLQNNENKIRPLEKTNFQSKKDKSQKLDFSSLEDENNSYISNIQEEIEVEDEYAVSIEREHSETVRKLQNQINEQRITIKSIKDQRFTIVQLQTQLDDRNRELEKIRIDYTKVCKELDSQIENNETAVDDIRYTMSSIKKFKNEIDNLTDQNNELHNEINDIQKELETSKGELFKAQIQLKESKNTSANLNKEMEKKDKIIEKIGKKQTKLLKDIETKSGMIEQLKNEISLLEAEKSFVKQSIPSNSINNSTTPKLVNNDLKDNDFKKQEKKIKKLQIELSSLKTQFNVQVEQNEEQKNLIDALKMNLNQSENSFSVLKVLSQKDKSLVLRNDDQILQMKNEKANLLSLIKDKEKLISEMMLSDSKKAKEIERLHFELSESRLKVISKEDESNQQQIHEQFKLILLQLSESRAKINELDLLSMNQKEKIENLLKENEDLNSQLYKCQHEISNLIEENCNIKNRNNELTLEYSSCVNRLQKDLDLVQNQFSVASKENKEYSSKNISLFEINNQNSIKINQLQSEITNLKSENTILFQKNESVLVPLNEENQRLKLSLEDIRLHERSLTDENHRLATEIESLKKEKIVQSEILEERINEKEDHIIQISNNNTEISNELIQYQSIFKDIASLYPIKSPLFILEFIKEKEGVISLIKDENNNLTKKNMELSKTMEKLLKEKQEMEDDKNKNTDQTIELKNKINIAKNENELLTSSINEIKNNLEYQIEINKKQQSKNDDYFHELENIKRVLIDNQKEKIGIDSESISNVNDFYEEEDNIEKMLKSIISLNLDYNEKLKSVKSQNSKLSAYSRRQKNVVDDLTKKNQLLQEQKEHLINQLSEIRKMTNSDSKTSLQKCFDLQNQLDKVKEEAELLKYEFNRFHSIVSFSKNEDLFFVCSQLLTEKNQEIEKLNFQLKFNETKATQRIKELSEFNSKTNEKLKSSSIVKEEIISLQNSLKLLEKEIQNQKYINENQKMIIDKDKKKLENIRNVVSCEKIIENKEDDVEILVDLLISEVKSRKESLSDLSEKNKKLVNENENLNDKIINLNQSNLSGTIESERTRIELQRYVNQQLLYFNADSFDQIKDKFNNLIKTNEIKQNQILALSLEKQKIEEMLKDKSTSNKNMQLENEYLKQSNEQSNMKYGTLETEFTQIKEKHIEIEKLYEQEIIKNQELQSKISDLEKENEELNIENIHIKDDYNKQNKHIKILSSQNQKLDKDNSLLSTKNKDISENINKLSSENSIISKEFSKHHEDSVLLAKENKLLKSDKKKLIKAKNKLFEEKKRLLELNNEFQIRLDSLSNKNQITETNYSTLDSKFDTLNQNIQDYSDLISELSTKAEELTTENKSLKNKNESLSNQLQTTISQNKNYYNDIQTLTTQVQKLTAENRNITAKVNSLSQKNQYLSKENVQISQQNQMLNNEIDEVKVREENLKIKNESLLNQNETFLTENESFSNDNSEIIGNNINMKNELELLQRKVIQLENENNLLKEQNDCFSKDNSQLTSLNKTLNNDIRLAQSKNTSYETQLKKIHEINESLNSKNIEITNEKDISKRNNSILKEQINSIKQNNDFLQKENIKLTIQNEKLDTNNKEITTEFHLSKKKMIQINSRIKELEKRNKTILSENTCLTQKKSELEMELNISIAKNNEMNRLITQLKEKISELKETNDNTTSILKASDDHIFKLKKKLRILREKISEFGATEREIVEKANELGKIHQNLQENYDNAEEKSDIIDRLNEVININNDMQLLFKKATKEKKLYQKETDDIENQYTIFMGSFNELVDMYNKTFSSTIHQGNISIKIKKEDQIFYYERIPTISSSLLSLPESEVLNVCSMIRLIRDSFVGLIKQTQQILNIAQKHGFENDNASEAIKFINNLLNDDTKEKELKTLQDTIKQITSASDIKDSEKNKQLDRIKTKVEIHKKTIQALVHYHCGDKTNIDFLKSQLSPEEIESLGISEK